MRPFFNSNYKKQRVQERKERTHRLCERCGYLESILPESVSLTAEQFKTFLDKTLLNDFARRTLVGLTEQDSDKTQETELRTQPKPLV